MSRHFDSTENAELRATIDKAKPLLPMPSLMRRLGYDEKHIGKAALCPFHSDEHPSFSVFQGKNGWQHKCHVGCSSGDEIAFLVKHFGISRREAISRFLDMAGFPAFAPDKSREYPESRAVPVSPVCLVSPVSEGQSVDNGIDVEKELRVLGAQNVCTHAKHAVAKKRFKLARDVKALELKIDRKLTAGELIGVFDEWYQPSGPFIPLADTREEHLAGFLAELEKVRVPTGQGALTGALENVSKLSLDELPTIPGYPNAPENCRRLAALHRELCRLSANGTYFLSYRDAAAVSDKLNHRTAHTMTFALVTLGVIEIVNKGEPNPNGGKAAQFRYLLPETESAPGAEEDDQGFDL